VRSLVKQSKIASVRCTALIISVLQDLKGALYYNTRFQWLEPRLFNETRVDNKRQRTLYNRVINSADRPTLHYHYRRG
jgi:hypothetical protein